MKGLHTLARVLLIVGGLNWLGVVALNANYVEKILGMDLATVAYWLVGLSAIYALVTWSKKSM